MAQGMYAQVALTGSHQFKVSRLVVTVDMLTLTVYDKVSLIASSEKGLTNGWLACASRRHLMSTPVSKDRFEQDFTDLCNAVSQVDKTTLVLPCGSKVVTYCVGEPVVEEGTGFMEMTWEREAWWMQNPHISPIVESIQQYYPNFAPWKGMKEPLISAMMARSSLL